MKNKTMFTQHYYYGVISNESSRSGQHLQNYSDAIVSEDASTTKELSSIVGRVK